MADSGSLSEERERLMAKLYPSQAIFGRLNRLIVGRMMFNGFHGRSSDLKSKMADRMLTVSIVDRLPLLDDPIFEKMRVDIRSEEFRKKVVLNELNDRVTVYAWKVHKGDMSVFGQLTNMIVPATLERQETASFVNLATLL